MCMCVRLRACACRVCAPHQSVSVPGPGSVSQACGVHVTCCVRGVCARDSVCEKRGKQPGNITLFSSLLAPEMQGWARGSIQL